MKKKTLVMAVMAMMVIIVASISLVACGGADITISKDTVSIEYGATTTLQVFEEGTYVSEGVSWESSDSDVVTVTSGVLKGVGVGEATITATYGGSSVTCEVTVVNAYSTTTSSATMKVGKNSFTMDFIINGSAVASGVTYSSSSDSVATVSNAGLVEAVSEGEATITATDGEGSVTCIVTVEANVYTLSGDAYTNVGSTADFVLYEDEDALATGVVWDTTDSEVATVSNGSVTGVGAGDVTISATYGGVTYTAEFVVLAAGAYMLSGNQDVFENISTSMTWEDPSTIYTSNFGSGTPLLLEGGVFTMTCIDNGPSSSGTARMIRFLPVNEDGTEYAGTYSVQYTVTNNTTLETTVGHNINGASTTWSTLEVDGTATYSKTVTSEGDWNSNNDHFQIKFYNYGTGVITISNIIITLNV